MTNNLGAWIVAIAIIITGSALYNQQAKIQTQTNTAAQATQTNQILITERVNLETIREACRYWAPLYGEGTSNLRYLHCNNLTNTASPFPAATQALVVQTVADCSINVYQHPEYDDFTSQFNMCVAKHTTGWVDVSQMNF